MTYKFGLTQPTRALTITCPRLPKTRIIEINQLFKENFKIENAINFLKIHPNLLKNQLNLSDDFFVASQQIALQAALAQQLQEHVGVPSFSQPLLLSYDGTAPSSATITTTILIPFYPQFNSLVITKIYELAQKTLDHLAKEGGSVKALESLLSKGNLEKLQKGIPSGKSTAPILRAAHEKKIPFFHLGHGIFQLGTGIYAHLFDKSAVDLDAMIGAKISQDKWLTKQLLQQLGFPTPKGQRLQDLKEAQALFQKWHTPVAIKPQNADRGEGITLNIESQEAIPHAFRHAQAYSKTILMEEMVPGICHRIGIAQGEILYVTQRNPKFVTGDDKHSIAELMEIANQAEMHKPPFLRKIKLVLDEGVLSHLSYQDLKPSDIPKLNQRVHLRPTESTEWGGIGEDKTEQIHPANAQLALDIAQALRLNVSGLDFMSVDITVPWYENQATVLEVNFSPFMASNSPSGRQKLEYFISQIFSKGSRIEHQIFVGDEAAKLAAQKAHKEALAQHRVAYMIQAAITQGPDRKPHHQTLGSNLYQRWYSLLLHPKVESLIIHIDHDELVDTGLPVDQIESFTIINDRIQSRTTQLDEQKKRYQQLLDLLSQHSSKEVIKNVEFQPQDY